MSEKKAATAKCDECERTFTNRAGANRHQRIRHSNPVFKCQECDRTYRIQKSLTDHEKKFHSKNSEYPPCKTCGHPLSLQKNQKSFSRSHSRSKPLICDFCGPSCDEKKLSLLTEEMKVSREELLFYIGRLYGNCLQHVKAFFNHDRFDAAEITIDEVFILNLLLSQNGTCTLSKIKMQIKGGNWLVAVDRMDNNKGYLPNNVRLICQEFNHAQYGHIKTAQENKLIKPWTKEKFALIKMLSSQTTNEHQFQTFNDMITEAEENPPRTSTRKFEPPESLKLKDVNLLKQASCRSCGKMKPPSAFRKTKNAWHHVSPSCKDCLNKKRYHAQRGINKRKERIFIPDVAKKKKSEILLKQLECIRCHQILPKNSFYVQKRSWHKRSSSCNVCTNQKEATLKHRLMRLLSAAKYRHKDKIGKECELTYTILLETYKRQKGRCYYSNIFMNFESLKDFCLSLERLDNSRGYEETNCVLICQEFQTSNQWTIDKFKFAFLNQ